MKQKNSFHNDDVIGDVVVTQCTLIHNGDVVNGDAANGNAIVNVFVMVTMLVCYDVVT